MENKTIVLIDGSSFLYRAYYGMRPLHTTDGTPVQAVYSFCRMLKKLVDRFDGQHFALVWDSKGPTMRHEMYAQYKATRQAPPSDLFGQKQLIQEFAELIEMAQVEKAGVEADDLIFALTKEFRQHDYNVLIVSSDKDLGQILGPGVSIFDSFKDAIITQESFEKASGIPVSKLPFFFALVGDTSDNIPGVRGIGKKTASDLVNRFESLEQMYQSLDQVTPRTAQFLEQNRDNAFLSQKLFTLHYQPTNTTESAVVFDKSKWAQARPFFEKLQFTSLLKELGGTNQQPQEQNQLPLSQKKGYVFRTVTTPQDLNEVIAHLEKHKIFALDTETDSLHPLTCTLVGLSICVQEGESFYIPLAHVTDQPQLLAASTLEALKPYFEDPQYKKILHNSKFDQLVLYAHGIDMKGLVFDTMVAASLVVPEWQSVGLKALSQAFFDEHMLTFETVVSKNKYPNFAHVPLELATEYAAADAHQTFKLWTILKQKLANEGLERVYHDIEHPLINVLTRMEVEGILCNVGALAKLEKQLTLSISIVEQEIYALTGIMPGTLNLNSPKQLEQLLFYQLKLPPQKKSGKKTGFSTDQEVLQVLSDLHVVPRLILQYRELHKLKSTYVSALPASVNPKTGRIHTSFSQTITATGRLASSSPNLQNIPVQEGDATVRSAFIAPPGHLFISADYSQIELRVLAYLAQDPVLVQAFAADIDIHAQTAAALFDVPVEQVISAQRQIGKRINFSVLYGLTPYGLSQDLHISLADAKRYIDAYFAQYAKVQPWMEMVVQEAQQKGYVTTIWGRRRYIQGINERNKSLFEAARRMAINTVAQGSAAEIMKIGMLKAHQVCAQHELKSNIVLQIHDELIISSPHEQAQITQKIIKQALESVTSWNVALKVTMRSGKTWQEVTK